MHTFNSVLILTIFMLMHGEIKSQIKIGLFADCQYCDCETIGKRYYRNSLEKLSDCITEFNKNHVDFVVGLGDLIDRDIESFDTINKILQNSDRQVYNITGNHDFEVDKNDYPKVLEKIGLKKPWYSFSKNGWRFIFLNGNEITFQSVDPEIIMQAEKMTKKLFENGKPNSAKWNAGIGNEQLSWLENELKKALQNNEKAIIFCHYPLLPLEAHTLWNSNEILEILYRYKNVKAWINGHNHAGNYIESGGIHFLNLKGMVDTEYQNAFSVLTINEENIEIKGFGREENRSLFLK